VILLDGDKHHGKILLDGQLGQSKKVILGPRVSADDQTTAVDINEHWEFPGGRGIGRNCDIEVETIHIRLSELFLGQ
jgi:hypothetical protein